MYEKVILIGFGKIAAEAIQIVSKYFKKKKFFISYEKDYFSLVEKIAKKNSFKIINSKNKKDNEKFLNSIEDNTLVISANNNYLFPKTIINKKNIKIINFHNSYLPRNRGRNAQVWAIYNMEKFGGFTWHYVTSSGLDAGPIIFRKKVNISQRTTGIELTKKCMDMGSKAFAVFFKNILNPNHKKKFYSKKSGKLYYSSNLPNNGKLNLNWDINRISAFLRCMDFKPLNLFPKQYFYINKKKYYILDYKILNTKFTKKKKSFLYNKLIIEEKRKKILIHYGKKNN